MSLKANIPLSDISPKAVNLFGPRNYSFKTVITCKCITSHFRTKMLYKSNVVLFCGCCQDELLSGWQRGEEKNAHQSSESVCKGQVCGGACTEPQGNSYTAS